MTFIAAAPGSGMIRIPGGEFLMGSDRFYREEAPVRRVSVAPFLIDPHPVTNAQFARFVQDTGYVTDAERPPDPAQYPNADPALLTPGSLVFVKPAQRVSLRDYRAWWRYVPGADWRHPQGPESALDGLGRHPVVHVSYADARAYAVWSGKSLPTEAEWEFAARGGLEGAVYPWGDEFNPQRRVMANTWQGEFPWQNRREDGYEGTSPVGVFPANGYGLYDVVGNVWEWTVSPFDAAAGEKAPCCAAAQTPHAQQRLTLKGGSHLCAPNYCLRYRPAARQGQTPDSATCHIGFRCIARIGEP